MKKCHFICFFLFSVWGYLHVLFICAGHPGRDETDSELTHTPSAKALFKLHVHIQETEALQAYKNITSNDRILFDMVMTPEYSNQGATDLETLQSDYHMMLQDLVLHGNSENDLLDKGRKDVCSEKLVEFDSRIAELVMGIKQRTHAISALAGNKSE